MDGVHGVTVVGPPKREQIQQQVQFILKWDQLSSLSMRWELYVMALFARSGFAGSQPVSMDVQNIRLLNEKPYRVSWKADGTRCSKYPVREVCL